MSLEEENSKLKKEVNILRKLLQGERDKDIIAPAINLLSVLSPIDWSYVFSAPGNGKHNAQRITDAMKYLEESLKRAEKL